MQKYALFSLSNKKEVFVDLAKLLERLGYTILASEGTKEFLNKKGIACKSLKEITGFSTKLKGKVKTINETIHSMILCDRDSKEEMEEIGKVGLIDFLAINFYNTDFSSLDSFLNSIDIGGRSLLNSAIKNFKHVSIAIDEKDCEKLIEELKMNGEVSIETKKKLALKAFEYLLDYEGRLYTYFYEACIGKSSMLMLLNEGEKLRYGENPHQKAYFFKSSTSGEDLELIKGQLSYNNLLDINTAVDLISEFEGIACAIIKHTNPSSVALSKDPKEAFLKAYSADPISAYGGTLAINYEIDSELAEIIANHFFDVILAKSYTDDAILKLSKRKKTKIVSFKALGKKVGQSYLIRSIFNGFLIQEKDTKTLEKSELKIVSKKKPSEKEIEDLLFAWKVVKHCFSNAIVIAKDSVTKGIGCGQQNRVSSVEIAIKKAGNDAKDAVMASDGFFPFRDSIDIAAEKGISAIIEPGGSIRDEEVIKAADEHGIALIFTNIRCFRH